VGHNRSVNGPTTKRTTSPGQLDGSPGTTVPFIPSTIPSTMLLLSVMAYVAASLIANVMSVRIVRIVGFSIDAGTLMYPLTFTLRDVIHKVGGRHAARVAILGTGALNVLLAAMLVAAARLPADLDVGQQSEFGRVLASTWRIVVASIVAQLVAEFIDTEIYTAVVARFGHRRQWARVFASNAISIPVDSVVFVLVAFGGEVTSSTAWAIIWANIVLKGATTLVSWPLIYTVREPPALETNTETSP